MKCPFCDNRSTLVKDSRGNTSAGQVRRRRYCESCRAKFSTLEKPILKELYVIKRSGVRKPFEISKIHAAINTALRKRNAGDQMIETIANRIYIYLQSLNETEIPTRRIGDMILEELAQIDEVAYIRFASVYKDFMTTKDFSRFINSIKTSKK